MSASNYGVYHVSCTKNHLDVHIIDRRECPKVKTLGGLLEVVCLQKQHTQRVVVEVLSMTTATGQMSNVVVADYELGGGVTKQVSLNKWSVKAALVEATEEVQLLKWS